MISDAPRFALKEWSVVCDLLSAGEIALLPKKGGIREWGGPGVFALEHNSFFLFPTTEHEKTDRIKPDFLAKLPSRAPADAEFLKLTAWARAEKVFRVPSREAFDRLDDLHPWLPPAIDMRFDYKPENPLHLVFLRVFRLREPRMIPHRAAYRGCRSWVPLEAEDTPPPDASPAMDDDTALTILNRVSEAFSRP